MALNCPRLMEFHDDQVYLVGSSENDKLIDAKFLELQVRGGGVQHLIEDAEVKFYGKTDDNSDVQLIALSGEDGLDYGYGYISLSGNNIDYEWDHGLVQTYAINAGPEALKIQAGERIKIGYLNGVATISSAASGEISGLTQDLSSPIIEYSGDDGSDYGYGSMTVWYTPSVYRKFDNGIAKAFDIDELTDSVTIEAGENVKIGYLDGVATISAAAPSGLTQALSSPIIEYSGEDGSDYGYGSMTIWYTPSINSDFDNGITKGFSVEDLTDSVTIEAGENIKIGYNDGVITINANVSSASGLTSSDFTEITVVTDVRLLSTGVLEKKTRNVYVFNPSSESAWISAGALETTTCPTSA
jgi:hypothetical protein